MEPLSGNNVFGDTPAELYIKSEVERCGKEAIENITCHEKVLDAHEKVLDAHEKVLDAMSNEFTERIMKSNDRIKILEQWIIDFKVSSDQLSEKLHEPLIKDVTEHGKYLSNQTLINKNVEQSLSKLKDIGNEFKEFKSRVNSSISMLQQDQDENEKYRKSKDSQTKRLTRFENKLNDMSIKFKKFEDTLTIDNTDMITKTINDTISECLKVNNEKNALILENVIKTNENRYDELNSKFRKLIDEIDLLRDNKHSSVMIEIDKINKKIAKITSIDITKIKMNNSDISNIEKKMKDKIDVLSINITKEIREQITKSQKPVPIESVPIESVSENLLQQHKIHERLSNIEQQMICQMSMFHSISTTAVSQYQYSEPKLYSTENM